MGVVRHYRDEFTSDRADCFGVGIGRLTYEGLVPAVCVVAYMAWMRPCDASIIFADAPAAHAKPLKRHGLI